MGKSSTPTYNPLTTAWIAATGESDTTIINALNTFEGGLISNSLTGKFYALYPFVGGDATKHSYNFMNTATYQLTFSGGWTHSATGSLPNGTTGYADTGLIPNSVMSLNDCHLSTYLRTNTTTGIDIGCAITGVVTYIYARLAGNFAANLNQASNSLAANTDSRGWFVASRTGASTINGYLNATNPIISTVASTSMPTVPIYIGARRINATVDNYSAREVAMASIGTGLSTVEAGTLYSLIQTFQTSLSRNV